MAGGYSAMLAPSWSPDDRLQRRTGQLSSKDKFGKPVQKPAQKCVGNSALLSPDVHDVLVRTS